MTTVPKWRHEEFGIAIDSHGIQRVLAAIAEHCQARAESECSHPYQSARWARRAKAIAQLAASFDDGND
jgi:hypothetical protein